MTHQISHKPGKGLFFTHHGKGKTRGHTPHAPVGKHAKTRRFVASLRFALFIATLLSLPQWTYAQMNTVSDAQSLGGDCYRLTSDNTNRAGAIWSSTTLDMSQDFQIQFSAHFGSKDVDGADGIAFVLHRNPNTTNALGGSGGAMGYAPLNGAFPSIRPSVAVEFDTYYNGNDAVRQRGDIGHYHDHISIVRNTDQSNPLSTVNATASADNIEDNQYHEIIISWNSSNTELSVFFDGDFRTSVQQDFVNSIFGGVPNVYWGMTSGTGSWHNEHRVCLGSVCTRPGIQTAIGEAFPHAPVDDEEGFSVKALDNCGYVLAGTSPTINGLNQMAVTETLEDGTINWMQNYIPTVGSGEGVLHNIEVLADGYAVTGWADLVARDIVTMRLDNAGNVLWALANGDNPNEMGYDIEQLHNGDFIVVGSSENDVILSRLSAFGTELWTRHYHWPTYRMQGFSVEPVDHDRDGVADDGFVIAGSRSFLDLTVSPPLVADADWMVLRTDANGNLLWAEGLTGSSEDDIAYTIKQIDVDGDGLLDPDRFAVGGFFTNSIMGVPRRDGLLVLLDHNLNCTGMFNQALLYSNGSTHSEIHALEQISGGGFILSGFFDETTVGANRDALLIQTDPTGLVVWSQGYGDQGVDDWARSVEEVDGLGYTFTGGTYSFFPDQDMYLVKTDINGNSPCKTAQAGFVGLNIQTVLGCNEDVMDDDYFASVDLNVLPIFPVTDQKFCSGGKRGPTGLEDMQTPELEMYPNPVVQGSMFNILLEPELVGETSIEVFDAMGRRVYFEENLTTGSHQAQVSTQGWSKGVYQISLKTGNSIRLQKLVVE